MVEISDIHDQESLEEWLNSFSDDEEVRRSAAAAISVRVYLRVLPPLWRIISRDSEFKNVLRVLQPALLTSVAGKVPTAENRKSAGAVYAAARTVVAAAAARGPRISPHDPTNFTSAAALFAVSTPAASAAVSAAAAAAGAAAELCSDIWSEIQTDCQALLYQRKLEGVGLWAGDNPLDADWQQIKTAHSPRPYGKGTHGDGPFGTVPGGPWGFWIDWYEKELTGAPQDWDFLQAVVDQVDWDGSPEEVNHQILRIERDHLLKTVRNLKEGISKVLADADELPSRGHNNPPELIEDEADAKSAITFI